ncbi:DUF5615 family PIN-like protein [Calothrix sp. UHCC 0171]|nr:DUF5615 family PIN-like protein [Calothrix sp. UHCC 0171]MEA5574580.1 DUF5615 family PIN-like protein [Calothrix sp. UHCC 0171]
MKLLLDENLSDRIINKIIDLYPDSQHVKTLALAQSRCLYWKHFLV